jgi:PhnB protein
VKAYTQLNFGGNCEEAFSFYESNLGGKIMMLMRQDQAPGAKPAGGAGQRVIHARLAIGGTVLVGNDVPLSVFEKIRSAYIFLSVDSTEEAERVYKLLAEGGQIYAPLAETFFATRFSQLRDRFGVSWSIIHERTMVQ